LIHNGVREGDADGDGLREAGDRNSTLLADELFSTGQVSDAQKLTARRSRDAPDFTVSIHWLCPLLELR
jgi:hypothetical protein